ncbi:hypothetical protein LCGC14_0850450 [marine sediment metagenome]|uniref:Smf/DprA SLOG domain-containing protein n=1 Tax=marine sediment metagenome TaxID=412755 RepID=A0A0F9PVR4_9ZZZZ
MQNLTYAGIGARTLQDEGRGTITAIAQLLAQHDFVVHSGAAEGADQTFSTAALDQGGTAVLHLPWRKHADDYLAGLSEDQLEHVDVRVLESKRNRRDQEAFASVDQHHPVADDLSWGARLLHARNYRILVPSENEPVKFCVALPSVVKGKAVGGTMQGIRIAKQLGIPVVRLDQLSRQRALDEVRARAGVGGLWS